MSNKSIILESLKEICGEDYVITSPDKCSIVERTTFKTTQTIEGILYPGNTKEVQQCVILANKYNLKLYPISGGKNIGLGGKIPIISGCFLVDLSRMNKILEYNADLAYIRIEAGVTQEQISNYLDEIDSNLVLSITGSLPSSTIIGNALERGDTSGPYTQRAEHICNLEIITGNGELLRTGFGRFKDSATSNLSKFGVGADYTGLFLQSNFGIVTSLTLWLSPRPKYLTKIAVSIESEEQLCEVVDVIRSLKLSNVIDNFGIWNDYKVISVFSSYPYEIIESKNKEFDAWFEGTKKKFGVEKWNCIITLRGESKLMNKARESIIKTSLKNKAKRIISTNSFMFKFLRSFKYLIEMLYRVKLDLLFTLPDKVNGLGVPTSTNVKSLYWRKNYSVLGVKELTQDHLNNPEVNNVGFVWACPALPLLGKDLVNATDLAASFIKEYGFEPNICILGISERLVTLALLIIYDRDIEEDDIRALECHDLLLKKFIDLGYMPNRLGTQSMHLIPKTNSYYEKFIQNIKESLDPNDVISPCRYDFRNNW